MKGKGIIWLVGLLALSLTLPVAAGAEMYFEVYMGGVAGATDNPTRNFNSSTSYNHPALIPPVTMPFTAFRTESQSISGSNLDPAVTGGLKIGTWFVKEGTLGYDYPNWMKYLGFFVDFSYQRLEMRQQGHSSVSESGQYEIWDPPHVIFKGMGNYSTNGSSGNTFTSDGMAATLAFMFTARYGLLADSDVPFGRLQPYVAVGPGILFTTLNQNMKFMYPDPSGRGYSLQHSDSATNICLVADAGIRWMAFKSVSIDAFFRYRYAEPGYSNMKTLSLFSGNLGAAYHF